MSGKYFPCNHTGGGRPGKKKEDSERRGGKKETANFGRGEGGLASVSVHRGKGDLTTDTRRLIKKWKQRLI